MGGSDAIASYESAPPDEYALPGGMSKAPHQPHIENFFNAMRGIAKLSCDARHVLDLNLKGTVMPTLRFAKLFKTQGFGCVLNFSSMAANNSITRVMGYSNAKAAIDNFTRWLASELALKYGDQFRVNAIAPGFFIGNQNRKLLVNETGDYTDRSKKIINKTPFGRFGKQEEVYGTVHYLISDASAFVTGAVVAVDGGFSSFSGV